MQIDAESFNAAAAGGRDLYRRIASNARAQEFNDLRLRLSATQLEIADILADLRRLIREMEQQRN